MNVPNNDKVPFRDMTPEERSAIVEAWIDGCIEYYSNQEWKGKCAGDAIFGGTVYRTKPRQLIIPWDVIKPEYKWAAMNESGNVYFYKDEPKIGVNGFNGGWVYAAIINIDTAGIDWRESLVQRPESV